MSCKYSAGELSSRGCTRWIVYDARQRNANSFSQRFLFRFKARWKKDSLPRANYFIREKVCLKLLQELYIDWIEDEIDLGTFRRPMAIRRRNDELPLLAGRMIDRAGFIKNGHRLSEFALRRRQTFILTQVNSTVVSNYMKFLKILFKNDYLNGRLRYLLERGVWYNVRFSPFFTEIVRILRAVISKDKNFISPCLRTNVSLLRRYIRVT